MPRELSTALPADPSVRLKDRKGSSFTGKYLGSFEIEQKNGKNYLHAFAFQEGDAPVTKQTNDDQYDLVYPNAGDKVKLFGSTILNAGLQHAKVGETVTITYLGKKGRMDNYKLVVND